MTKRTILELLLKGRDQGAKKALDDVEGRMNDVEKSSDDMAGTLKMAGQAMQAFALKETAQAVYELGRLGAESKRTTKAFENISGGANKAQENLDAMKRATRNAMSETAMMANANKLMQMGLAKNADEMENVTKMATRLGGAMGMTAGQSMDDFAALLANKSLPRLDQFGIASGKVRERFNELKATMSEDEAFKLAVMEEGQAALERLGPAVEDNALAFEQLEARLQDFKTVIAEGVAPELANLLNTITPLIEKGTEFQSAYSQAHEETGKFGDVVRYLVPGVYALSTSIEALTGKTEDGQAAIGMITPVLDSLSDKMLRAGQVSGQASQAMDDFADSELAGAEASGELATKLKDATDAQIANRLIGMLDPKKMGATAYSGAVQEIGIAFGVMDEQSIALAEAMPELAGAIEDGIIPIEDADEALKYLIEDSEDGEVVIDDLGWTSRAAGALVSRFAGGLERSNEAIEALKMTGPGGAQPFSEIGGAASSQAPALTTFSDRLGTTEEHLRDLKAGSPWTITVETSSGGGGGGGGGGPGPEPGIQVAGGNQFEVNITTGALNSRTDIEDLAYRVSEVLAQRLGSQMRARGV